MRKQIVPISISLGMFVLFSVITFYLLHALNTVGPGNILIQFTWGQFLIGMLIYLKTAVDYAIFVGLLMDKNPGTPKRIAMNAGTSTGAFIGVTAIAVLWYFFKEIHWLMFILLFVSAGILFSLGDASQEYFEKVDKRLRYPLELFFKITRPLVKVLTFFLPEGEIKPKSMGTKKLFFFSGVLPFVLGSDDLAGYMVLLSPINIFSILLGIYFADAVIDIALFYNHKWTVKAVKNKWISYLGALFFIGLGIMSIMGALKLYF